MKQRSAIRLMVVAGVMSGTSADGVDVALCRIGASRGGEEPRVRLLGMKSFAYPKAVRAEVLAVAGGERRTAAEMGRLNWRLGEIYAACVAKTAEQFGVPPALVGCHGQTIHHETTALGFLGAKVRSTWQTGEPSVIAERMRCPVVSDFRPADVAAGGQGAPLVPMLDWCVFRSRTVNRVLLNVGGIANMTVIPAGARQDEVIAFDSGPGNMTIDRAMAELRGRGFDRNGATAARGRVLEDVVAKMLGGRYFSALPPKSCGREEFGAEFTARLIAACRKRGAEHEDCVATVTAVTAESVVEAYRRFAEPRLVHGAKVELCVAGGGAKNRTLMTMLAAKMAELRVSLRTTEELGVPSQAKEAVAFAMLAWLTWHGLPGNVPSATGAKRAVVLGKVTRG